MGPLSNIYFAIIGDGISIYSTGHSLLGINIISRGYGTRPTESLDDLENWVEGRPELPTVHIAQKFAYGA